VRAKAREVNPAIVVFFRVDFTVEFTAEPPFSIQTDRKVDPIGDLDFKKDAMRYNESGEIESF